MEFSDRLKEIMRSRDIKQIDLARIAGVSVNTAAGYMKGRFLPGYIAMRNMAKRLNISADYLLGLTDVPRAAVYHGMNCANCRFNDGYVYTSLPPKYRCTITGEYNFGEHECNVDSNTLNNDAMRWIPVTERLPDNSSTVLVCDSFGDITFGYRHRVIVGGIKYPESWEVIQDLDGEITHWMPLPEPPKEET